MSQAALFSIQSSIFVQEFERFRIGSLQRHLHQLICLLDKDRLNKWWRAMQPGTPGGQAWCCGTVRHLEEIESRQFTAV